MIAGVALAGLATVPATAQIGSGATTDSYPQNGPNPGYGYGNNGGGNDGGRYPGGGYPGGGGGYPGGGQRQTITCESANYRFTRCGADTRGGVRLVQQIGDSACVQGRTWGFDRGGVWVNNGCRGVFRTFGGGGYPGGGYPGGPGGGRTITCSSIQYQPARCAVDVYRGAQLVENISGSCNGRNWGWDRGGVWVNNGCRGRFRVY